ncbi:hypothetical protein KBD34_00735 [Patescibacteria group bacterium]|nr:hypothetical protein [Patescibacteria group bacterium]
MPKRPSSRPEASPLVESEVRSSPESVIEHEPVPAPSQPEICAAACALGLDPFDVESQERAREKLSTYEYAQVRQEVIDQMRRDFFVDSDGFFIRRPLPEALNQLRPENKQVRTILEDAFLTIQSPGLFAIADLWTKDTPKLDRGKERELPVEVSDAIQQQLDAIKSSVRGPFTVSGVHDRKNADFLLGTSLISMDNYRVISSEQGFKRPVDDSFYSLDVQNPLWRGKDGTGSFAATWTWLGPIVNKAAAYLGVEFSEGDNHPDYRTPYYASVVKDGVIIPKKSAETPGVAYLIEACREAQDEGLELRKQRSAETRKFSKMQLERQRDVEALEADVKETYRLIGLFSDHVEAFYSRERQDFRDSESGVAHAQLQKERNELGAKVKVLMDQRSSLKGGDGLLARAREFYHRSAIDRIDVELAQLAERLNSIMSLEAVSERKIMEAVWSERLSTVYRARASDLLIRVGMIQDQLPAIRQPYLVGRDPAPFQKVRMQLTQLLDELTQLQEPLVDEGTRGKLETRGDWSPLTDQERVELQAGADLHQDEEKRKKRRSTPPKGAKRPPISQTKSHLN